MADGDGRAILTLAEEVWRAAPAGAVFDVAVSDRDRAAARAAVRQGTGRPLQSHQRAAQIACAVVMMTRRSIGSRACSPGGEERGFIARRLARFANEDIGLADPHALVDVAPRGVGSL